MNDKQGSQCIGCRLTREENEALRAHLEKITRCLAAYNEYFSAIADGEYTSNLRPAPLRAFEQLLLDKGRAALKECRGET